MTTWRRLFAVGVLVAMSTASHARGADVRHSEVPQDAIDGEPLSPAQDYCADRTSPVTHDIDFRAIVTPPHGCEKLRVWLPLPQSDAGQEVLWFELSAFPQLVQPQIDREPVYGNRFAYFEFDHPRGAQIIQHRLTVKVWDLHWKVDPAQVTSVATWPETFAPYLRPQPVTKADEFNAVLSEVVPLRGNAAHDLRHVIDWVDRSLTYDHIHASLRADANHAFEQRRGHCSDYHGLCATMGRALGYPTRVTYGLALFPKDSPSHCKLEAFLPPYGWVSYDVSETQKLVGKITKREDLAAPHRAALAAAARQRLHQGFRENSWLLLTRGTDYELAPPASQPVRVVRTIYAEADGVPLPEPDPANIEQHEFSWMTAHRYRSDVPFAMPFEDPETLVVEGADKKIEYRELQR